MHSFSAMLRDPLRTNSLHRAHPILNHLAQPPKVSASLQHSTHLFRPAMQSLPPRRIRLVPRHPLNAKPLPIAPQPQIPRTVVRLGQPRRQLVLVHDARAFGDAQVVCCFGVEEARAGAVDGVALFAGAGVGVCSCCAWGGGG